MRLNYGIQILRAICAIQVFLSHTLNVYKSTIITDLTHSPFHYFFDGQCAVILFFVLSGFFYYTDKPLTLKGYLNKIVSKTLKIFPVYLISILIGTLLCNVYFKNNILGNSEIETQWIFAFWKQNISIIDFIKACFIFPLESTDIINPPSWYLLVEIKMYFIMPILIYFFNRFGWWLAYIFLFFVFFFYSSPIGCFIIGAIFHKYLNNLNSNHLFCKLFFYCPY